MKRTEIRITGFGGQGVVLSGHIIGKACSVHAGHHATMMQSFGPEARGSSCSSTLVCSEDEVLYPYLRAPDILVTMSRDGYAQHGSALKTDGGILVYESDLVEPSVADTQKAFGIPSTRIAEEMGRSIVANIVMVGFFSAVTDLVASEDMRAAVLSSVPAGTEELNIRAFEQGLAHAEKEYGLQTAAG